MKEIEFRGRCIGMNKDKWVYGYYRKEVDDSHWVRYRIAKTHYADAEVDPKTVEQYIELKDNNNKKIFEGDRVLNKDGFEKIVYFDKEYLQWRLGKFGIKTQFDKTESVFVNSDNIEVIGHI